MKVCKGEGEEISKVIMLLGYWVCTCFIILACVVGILTMEKLNRLPREMMGC